MRQRNAPFGRTLCAMVTPFTPAGTLDVDGAARLAGRLVVDTEARAKLLALYEAGVPARDPGRVS